MSELNSELLPGEPELSKQELTRQLANRWRSLDTNNKQIYINKYESSKQKYNEEMQCYRRDAGIGGDSALAVGVESLITSNKAVATAAAEIALTTAASHRAADF